MPRELIDTALYVLHTMDNQGSVIQQGELHLSELELYRCFSNMLFMSYRVLDNACLTSLVCPCNRFFLTIFTRKEIVRKNWFRLH